MRKPVPLLPVATKESVEITLLRTLTVNARHAVLALTMKAEELLKVRETANERRAENELLEAQIRLLQEDKKQLALTVSSEYNRAQRAIAEAAYWRGRARDMEEKLRELQKHTAAKQTLKSVNEL